MKNLSICNNSKKLTALFLLAGLLLAAAVPVYAGGAQEEASVIDVPDRTRVYIAPGEEDAEYQTLTLRPDLKLAPDRVILRYELVIFTTDGEEVRSISAEETRRRGFFGRLFDVGERPQIDPAVIEELEWDGRNNSEEIVPDGEYIYQLFIEDDEGEVFRTSPQTVTVDTEAPEITNLEADYRSFSPGVDGQRPELKIRQEGSREVRWTGRFYNEDGDVVREYRWENPVQYDPSESRQQQPREDKEPEALRWDGRNDDGEIVPDGTYRYELTGRDRAGNRSSETIDNLQVVTEGGSVQLSANRSAFSPEGPVPDVTFETAVDSPVGVMEWEAAVTKPEDESEVYYEVEGEGEPPAEFRWDGTDETGRVLSDGTYSAELTVLFENGLRESSRPLDITIDTEQPVARLSSNHEVFGGSAKPEVRIDGDWDTDAEWTAVAKMNGEMYEVQLEEYDITPDDLPYTWDGSDLDGNQLPDGEYTLWLEGEDRAGNRGRTEKLEIEKDTRETPIDVEISDDVVAPEFADMHDEIAIRPILEVSDGIEEIRVSIQDEDGKSLRTFSRDEAFEEVLWEGLDDRRQVVEEGEYMVEIQVFYRNGNEPTASEGPVFVDRDAPEVSLSVPYSSFAANDDGYRDTLPVEVQPEGEEQVDEWIMKVYRRGEEEEEPHRTIAGEGTPPDTIEWDGRDDLGEIVDGHYRIGVLLRYDGGGEVEYTLEDRVLLDASAPELEITADPIPFSPASLDENGDDEKEELTFGLDAEDSYSEISQWSLQVEDPAGDIVKEFSGEGDPPSEITWDGRIDDDSYLQSGVRYEAEFSAEDELKNRGTEGFEILVDIMVRREGDRLRIVVPSIHFEPNTGYLFEEIDERLMENLLTLRNLAGILNRFDGRDIIIEGHANHVLYEDADRKAAEQRNTLIPLSRSRARAVRDALAILGVDIERMTIEAIGGDRPEVPFDSGRRTWRNRRVEFWLDRNDEE
ncbi:MAG: hypothetical protein ACLFSA_04960 [Spirochaetaceae bacterium]